MEEEIWKDIPGYEGLYQVSNFGNAKSLDRIIYRSNILVNRKGKLLNLILNSSCGYYRIKIQGKAYSVHKLVAMAFLDHIPNGMNKIIDHIDNNPLNNRLCNLQIVDVRTNVSKDVKNASSIYTGVSYDKERKKWASNIVINKKRIALGRYEKEEMAAELYQLALQNIHLFDGDSKKFRALINFL